MQKGRRLGSHVAKTGSVEYETIPPLLAFADSQAGYVQPPNTSYPPLSLFRSLLATCLQPRVNRDNTGAN